MAVLTPDEAHDAVEALPYSAGRLKTRGTGHLKYAYLHDLKVQVARDIAISRRPTQNGVTVYVNRFSGAGEEFPVQSCADRFPGVSVTEQYPRGYRGATGEIGLASSAGRCPTLVPADHAVLRLSCSNLDGFKKLVRWYAGEVKLGVSPPPPPPPALQLSTQAPSAQAVADLGAAGTSAGPGISDPLPPELHDSEEAGWLNDPAKRAAVERHAVILATAHYASRGFDVQEKGKPYDLLCTPTARSAQGTPVVHVEVKGSVSAAAVVHLTRNEVADARQVGKDWRSDLFVVSQITLRPGASGAWTGEGGVAECFESWCPRDDDLTPTDFVYRVQRSPGH